MGEAPRMLAVLHLAEPGGPSTDLGAHLGWIAEQGRLDVLVPGPGRAASAFGPTARVAEAPYAALTVPRSPAAVARLGAALRRETRTFRARVRATAPELVVVATTTLPAALLAARLEKVPALVYAAELLTGEASGRSGPGAAAGRALLSLNHRLAASVVACSETVARQFPPGPETSTVHPPIADAAEGDGARFRAEHRIEPDEPCVVAVGNVSRGRGQDVLIRALARVRRTVPDARVAIVGEPFPRAADLEFRAELDRVAAELGLAGAVSFCGFVERIADAYAAADVFVNPTRFPEAFGRAACEALVAGRPVVSSGIGATPEVLRNGETAVLVPPEDEAALAQAVEALLRDPERGAAIAAAGRRDVLERFDPDRARAAFGRAIERVAD